MSFIHTIKTSGNCRSKISTGYFLCLLILFVLFSVKFSAFADTTKVYGASTALTTVDNLRLRALPKSGGKTLALIPEGVQVQLLGEKSPTKSTYTLRGVTHEKYWFKVRYKGVEGWVFGGGTALQNLNLYDQTALKNLPVPEGKAVNLSIDGSKGFYGDPIEKSLTTYLDTQLELISKKNSDEHEDYTGIIETYGIKGSDLKVIKDCGEWLMSTVCKFKFPGFSVGEVYALVRSLCPGCLKSIGGIQEGSETRMGQFDFDGEKTEVKVNISFEFDERENLKKITNSWNDGIANLKIVIKDGIPTIINDFDLV